MVSMGSHATATARSRPASAVDVRIDGLLEGLRDRGIRPGLGTMERLLAAFGDPHLDLSMVLVAGTNGKGSTAALLAAMARAAGYRVGLYTSPHLERISDVLSIDPVSNGSVGEELASSLAEVVDRGHDLALPLTPFEALTSAALRVLARRRVDLAVIEAGLGGRLDATNVGQPLLSILTTVDLDHQGFLGTKRLAIAEHKAGIFRPGRPAIIGWCDDLEKPLRSLACERGAVPILANEAVDLEPGPAGAWPQSVTVRTADQCHHLHLPLAGAHQARNLALAVLAAERLARDGFPRLDAPAIAEGCQGVHWPGRLEWLTPGILLDTAHNPAAVRALVDTVGHHDGPWDLLFGTLAGKDAHGMLEILGPLARRIVLTAPDDPRAWDPREAAPLLPFAASVVPRLEEALKAHLATTSPDDPPLLITGSLRLVGQSRAWLRRYLAAGPFPIEDSEP